MNNGPVRIALLGVFGVDNFGNEASLEAMLRQIRARLPRADLVCICVSPARVAQQQAISSLAMTQPRVQSCQRRLSFAGVLAGITRRFGLSWLDRARYAYLQLKGVDFLVVPGTGILDDYQTGPWGLPFTVLLYIVAARLRRATTILAAIGAGPIYDDRSRRIMAWTARLAHVRSFRDIYSREYLKSVGVNVDKDAVIPDLAFSLPVPADDGVVARSHHAVIVALGIMSYRGWYRDSARGDRIYEHYIARIVTFVVWLLQAGHTVRLVIGQISDREAVEEIRNRIDQLNLPGSLRLSSPRVESFQDLQRELAQVHLVVATRYHNVVAALLATKPVISVGYAAKNRFLLEEMGLGCYCQDIESFRLDVLQSHFVELVRQREIASARIRTCVERYRSQLDSYLASLFGASPSEVRQVPLRSRS